MTLEDEEIPTTDELASMLIEENGVLVLPHVEFINGKWHVVPLANNPSPLTEAAIDKAMRKAKKSATQREKRAAKAATRKKIEEKATANRRATEESAAIRITHQDSICNNPAQ